MDRPPFRRSRALAAALTAALAGTVPLAGQECEPGPGVLTGTLRDSVTQVVLPGATVVARWLTGAEVHTREASTDLSGGFRLCGVSTTEEVSLATRFANHMAAPVTITLRPDGVTERHLTLAMTAAAAQSTVTTSRVVGPSGLMGVVLDRETKRPVEGAVLTLGDTDAQALTDPRGRFRLADVPPGDWTLHIEHIAYGEVAEALDIPVDVTLEVRAEVVPRAIAMEPLLVTAVRRPRLEHRGFYERREWGEKLSIGHFITQDEIDQWRTTRISALLQRVPMMEIMRLCPQDRLEAVVVGYGTCVQMPKVRGSAPRYAHVYGAIVPVDCPADVWIDGIRARLFSWGPRGELEIRGDLDELGLPSEVAGIEIYRRASELPADFGGATDGCGAVVIWTR